MRVLAVLLLGSVGLVLQVRAQDDLELVSGGGPALAINGSSDVKPTTRFSGGSGALFAGLSLSQVSCPCA
jgi:hypothetical protein